MDKPTQRNCFIIGPMRDAHLKEEARLERLAREVIRPLLNKLAEDTGLSYLVQTPYDLGGGNIMNDVIYAIDRADLVIADLTDSNPNVFYELGICHSLGRACLAVMESRQTKVEFDVSAYRVFKLDLDEANYAEAQLILAGPLRQIHQQLDDWTRFENPVVDFYRAPVTYISPAHALAEGYFYNFVKPVVEAMIRRKGSGAYLYDVGVEADAQRQIQKLEQSQVLPFSLRDQMVLQIVIPQYIRLAKHRFADRLRGHLPQAVIEGDGRTYTCFWRPEATALLDIPTTLRVLEGAVNRRMRLPNTPPENREWQEVEQQELARFRLNLQLLVNAHEDNPEFSRRLQIISYELKNPGEWEWLNPILNY